MSRPRLMSLLLMLITLMVYLPVAHDDFLTYDDDDYVTNNRVVQQGLTWYGVRWAFTTVHAANWHPLTWISHMADCEFFGLNAGAHHLVNVLFHAINAALLFALLWRLTNKMWPSALVAALFAWHPLHVESVAWVAERKDVLSTFFALLALLSYAQFAQKHSRRSYSFALLFFGLGLLAKPMLVTLPFVFLLLDFWPLKRFTFEQFRWPLVWEKTPFFILTAASCIVTYYAQQTGGAVIAMDQLPLGYRLENAAVSVARYLLNIFWPVNLAVIYPRLLISPGALVLAMAVLMLVSILAWRVRNRHGCWLVGWLWFVGMLVPVIGLVQVGGAAMADRYSYLPSVGVGIAVVFGLAEFTWSKRLVPVAAVLLAVCVAITEKQLTYWRDTETLFRHTLAVTPGNEFAHFNLGRALAARGDTAGALAEYREGLRINPYYYQAHFAIGNLLLSLGRPGDALVEFQQCIAKGPNVPALHDAAGNALAAQGNLPAALQEFAAAERLDPTYAQPHLDVAKIYLARGQDDYAVPELEAAARAEPYDYEVLAAVAFYLAVNSDAPGRNGIEALALALKANDLSGNRHSEVFDALGTALAAVGDFTNAITSAQNALEFTSPADTNRIGLLQQRLEHYKMRQPWLESFRVTNAPAK